MVLAVRLPPKRRLYICCLLLVLAWSPLASEPTRVDVVVTASHHHVLPYWYRAARRGQLPREALTVVHLDAHPDLAVPGGSVAPGFPPDDFAHQASIDIASFQLAAARAGLVRRVLWLRPAWADQITDGEHRFRLGTGPGDSLRVDSPLDYYVLNDAYRATSDLRDAVDVELRVLVLEPESDERLVPEGTPFILDIDLDIFSTRNPAVDRLAAAGFSDEEIAVVRRVFARSNLNLSSEPSERIADLEAIESAIEIVTAGGLLESLWAAGTLWWYGISPLEMSELFSLLDGKSYEQLDALLREGRVVVGVPAYRSDQAEVEATLRAFEKLVQRRLGRPALVTIARSMRDGFTHPFWVGPVEAGVLEILRRELGPTRVIYDRELKPLDF